MANGVQVDVYDSALRVPSSVLDTLRGNERNANCVLPILLKSRVFESQGQAPPQKQVWVVCSSKNADGETTIEFVLSITEGYIDSYPAFLFTTLSTRHLTHDFLQRRMELVAKALSRAVPVERVYAVYGPDVLAKAFAWNWTNITSVQNIVEAPYYAAKISFCTRETFKHNAVPLRSDLTSEIRPANEDDFNDVMRCCLGFAADSDPYVLTEEGAKREANFLIHQNQIWVHRIGQSGSSQSGIASIVAFTRNSETNATITKVYTNPNYRRLGCAERLVRKVCGFLLQTKVTVTLFVAHQNPGAAAVYSRVGFVGLDPQEGAVLGVEGWTEIGFDRNSVRLGHW